MTPPAPSPPSVPFALPVRERPLSVVVSDILDANGHWLALCEPQDASAIIAAINAYYEPTRRQVMNPPADEAEAGNLANTAPLQPDHDGQRRGLTGTSSWPEARPVTATAQPDFYCPSAQATERERLSTHLENVK